MDFKDAFGNLEWKCVLERLRDVGCEELGLWESYFYERRVCMVGAREVVLEGSGSWLPAGLHLWSVYMEPHDGLTVVAVS